MASRKNELDQIKTQIDLRAFAASLGYERDRKDSSLNSTCMRLGADKVFIAVGYTGQWIYWNVFDAQDNGTIVDFAAKRLNLFSGSTLDIGAVRKELRPWIGVSGGTYPEYHRFGSKPQPIKKDLQAVLSDFAAAETVGEHRGHHPYLCDQRAVPASVLNSERFRDSVRIDRRGNALFGHYDLEGLCGIEIKNDGYTAMHKSGSKGLWAAGKKNDDKQLVIAEAAIDAISHAVLFPNTNSRYVSTAGALNRIQPGLLNRAMSNMPQGSTIVLAIDNDEGGEKMIGAIRPIYEHVRDSGGRGDLQYRVHRPEEHKDWNDVLRNPPTLPIPSHE